MEPLSKESRFLVERCFKAPACLCSLLLLSILSAISPKISCGLETICLVIIYIHIPELSCLDPDVLMYLCKSVATMYSCLHVESESYCSDIIVVMRI
jgi:hypothetical protein